MDETGAMTGVSASQISWSAGKIDIRLWLGQSSWKHQLQKLQSV